MNLKQQIQAARLFLSATPALANWIGLTTTLVWVLKAVWFDHVPELFPGAYDLGRVFEGLLSALLAGYVFYILFALYPEYQSRRRLYPFVFGKIRGLVGDCMHIFLETNNASKRNLILSNATSEDILSSFTAVDTSISPRMGHWHNGAFVPVKWWHYFRNQQLRSQETIKSLFDQGHFLDSELVALLTDIDTCSFLMQVKLTAEIVVTAGQAVDNPNLSVWAPEFAKYAALCRRLAEWHDNHRGPDTLPLVGQEWG
ncbi:hypothetical protein [Methylobacterium sp. J-077]|uniref:hypothetical protein n=1 Tax=Methylobacterium sp. J-077 TaxID=2836656 RepID=UPI001FBB5622|nr:hypothetical protein [Methylobacterium sp. J-077]MCJ2124780.1 hypothetical protein [Methylobacterium sp. J-077]